MRQWQLDPRGMCRQHLLGEHYELHSLIGCALSDKAAGRRRARSAAASGHADFRRIRARHDELAEELVRRGYSHNSPTRRGRLAQFGGYIDTYLALVDLTTRCDNCREGYHEIVGDLIEVEEIEEVV